MRRRDLPLVLGALAAPCTARAQAARAPLTVGPGGTFARLAAAVAAAADGDTILLAPGTYRDEVAEIRRPLTIRANGGTARLLATVPPPNGKAILVIGADATVEGLELTGATGPGLNGAGIRYEGGHLRLHRCHLHGNQMNLLAAPVPAGSIAITACEFGPTLPTASLSHGLYVNGVGSLEATGSLFHGAASGHQIKSRALRTVVRGCRIYDGEGEGAYCVDLPNGGECLVEDNLIEQGPRSRNPAILNFGGEGEPHPRSSLRVAGNTVVNRLASAAAVLLRNHTAAVAILADNRVFGLTAGRMAEGPATVSRTTILAAQPPLDLAPPWRTEPAPRR